MANFKTHISTGLLIGIICAVSAIIFGIITSWDIVIFIILFISIGSILPDIDSDSSIPFRIIFYILAGITSFFAFLMLHHQNLYTPLINIIISTFIFLFIRFVLGAIFKKFTHHRGIFHSIPMAIIFVLITIHALNIFTTINFQSQFIISIALGIGFISHLILDEIYSAINFNGKKFHPNKNLGSALKLWSHSVLITLTTYLILIILLYLYIF
jgi:hypothetical protein